MYYSQALPNLLSNIRSKSSCFVATKYKSPSNTAEPTQGNKRKYIKPVQNPSTPKKQIKICIPPKIKPAPQKKQQKTAKSLNILSTTPRKLLKTVTPQKVVAPNNFIDLFEDSDCEIMEQVIPNINPVVVDLTQDETELASIKQQHPLFFTYDPTGVDPSKMHTSIEYCRSCKCPEVYCCNTIFGPMCHKDVERLVCKNGFEDYEDETELKSCFKCIYTDLVKCKMLMNNVSLHGINDYKYMALPKCVKRGYLKKLIDDLSLWEHQEEERMNEREEAIAAIYDKSDDEPADLPDLVDRSIEEELDVVHVVVNPYLPQKRTAIEQAKDVSLLFKAMKTHVKNAINKTEKEEEEV